MDVQQLIQQLAHRLENSSNSLNSERIEALEELQSLAKKSPPLVGEIALNRVLDFLQEQVHGLCSESLFRLLAPLDYCL
jgi:hypothetical protein